ncbi:MAG: type II toxin-antitoxin system PemK/MazF family toxin [Chitinophagales bacterium]|nr:type II toxin-antitoxin system PemK/MazF family toxin [Chitinophagales bacterium]
MFDKGDIVWLKFPFSDLNRSKSRPALVLSDSRVNKTGDYMLVSITSKIREDGLSIAIAENETDEPLQLKSFIRCHKLFTADKSLISGKLTRIKPRLYRKVVEKINSLIS